MRNNFADEITKLAASDPRVVLLSGDIGNKLFDGFKAKAPERFFNCGVAEANMMGVAAGLAMSGLRPVVYTIAPFTTTRVMEQIRVDVCYHHVPVTIVGVGSGLGYASLGATHHSCEDMAMLRSLPGMSVMAPGDPLEVRACLRAALRHDGPAYIRMGKKGEPVVHRDMPAVEIGRSLIVREGVDVCLMPVGVLLPMAIEAAEALGRRGISARVVSVVSVKPLDTACLTESFARFPVVVTMEEHSLIGGFGAAVAEWLVDSGTAGGRLLRVGTADRFLHEAGETEYARAANGISVEHVVERVVKALPPRRKAVALP